MVTPAFLPTPGGIGLLLHRLVQHWARVDARIVTLQVAGADEFDSGNSVKPKRITRPPALGHRGALGVLNIASFLEAWGWRPHVVLSGYVNVAPACYAINRLLGVPYLQYLYGKELFVRPGASSFAICHAAGVIAISRHTESTALSRGAEPSCVHRIPPGVDLGPPRRNERSKRPTIVIVSRLDERYKGHDVLIRAVPLVRSRVPDAHLVIIGDGVLRPVYEDLVQALRISDGVTFLGAVNDRERNAWLERAHVFAMPSRLSPGGGFEGFGIAYLEAGARELPVVAGNVAGALDAVVHGETGLLVDPTHHVAVADALCYLLLHPDEAEELGRAGRQRAQQFSWPKMAKHVEDVLLATTASSA